MPSEKIELQNGNGNTLCPRCKSNPSLLKIRGEHFCQFCFLDYTQSKVAKKMESFRVRHSKNNEPRRLLLPLSCGVSSLALLHALDRLLHRQKSRTRRVGFELDVLVILDSESTEHAVEKSLDALKERYPSYKYHVKPLDDVDVNSYRWIQDPETPVNDSISNELSSKHHLNSRHSFSSMSATSRTHVLELHRTHQIVHEAKALGCEGVLWGHTTTRLAERILAETAKGRGFALPWLASDGLNPFDVTFTYPLKELLKKEIVLYAEHCEPPLLDLAVDSLDKQTPAASKNSTIDDLMKDYFTTVEESYPSIVANVVRTSNKLIPGQSDHSCWMCRLPIPLDSSAKGDNSEAQDLSILSPTSDPSLCRACSAIAR